MKTRKLYLLVAVLVVFISLEVPSVQGNSRAKGLSGKKGALDAASTNYRVLPPKNANDKREHVFCLARGKCHNRILECPAECPERKPKKNKKVKGCFIDCSSKCETTCKCKFTFTLL